MKCCNLYKLPIALTFFFTLPAPASTIHLKILGINDFHGQISTGRMVKNEPVGGAAVLSSYLKAAQKGMEDRTVITIMGDQVGASPPASGLLHDEPSILYTNTLGNAYCNTKDRMNPLCNVVATVGNHEFDKGQQAMMELIYGTNRPPADEWIPLPIYPGANYPYISANILDANTHQPLFPPYTIKIVDGIPVAFIGALLKNAADSMFPANAKGVEFFDEAETINSYIPEIQAKGVHVIVAIMHEGGNQTPYVGDTQLNSHVDGRINDIVDHLDDAVDVVMGGHTHQFLNAYLPNHHGKQILVTQANSYSASFAEVSLQIDSESQQVMHKSARIITTFANKGPGTTPNTQVQQLVSLAEDKVAPIVNGYVGTLHNPLVRRQNEDGECNIGNLIADAMRHEMKAEIGLTNPHGLRDDLQPGVITWGKLYSVLPFANQVVTVGLSGQDIGELLEQQWMGDYPNMLQISGLQYVYNAANPLGQHIVSLNALGKPIDKNKMYTIATTDFLANGGGIFSVMKRSQLIQTGDSDHNTVMHYIRGLKQPFAAYIEGRIKRM